MSAPDKRKARSLATPSLPAPPTTDREAPEASTLPSATPKRKTQNIPDAQRGERGELLAVRVTRGTRALVVSIAGAWECSQGEVLEAALASLGEAGAWVRATSAAGRRRSRRS